MRTRVKICGITNIEDAMAAVNMGADALGFIFYSNSPRNIAISVAKEIIANLPPFVTPVAVVVNSTDYELNNILNETNCRVVQYHGDFSGLMNANNIPIIPAISIQEESDLDIIKQYLKSPAVLLDTKKSGLYGGSGEIFDWEIAKKATIYNKPIILAGGLSVENIREAISKVNPWAIDINSKIEKEPGIKDHIKMQEIFNILKSI